MSFIVDAPYEIRHMFDEPFDGLIVVFDLDGTLIRATEDGTDIYVRNYAQQMLADLFAVGVKIIVWSAVIECHVERCMALLDPKHIYIQGAVSRGNWMGDWMKYFRNAKDTPCNDQMPEPILKDVSMLVDDMEKLYQIILIDDTPSTVRKYPKNGIIIKTFDPHSESANTQILVHLTKFLAKIHRKLKNGDIVDVADVIHANTITKLEMSKYPHCGTFYWHTFNPPI